MCKIVDTSGMVEVDPMEDIGYGGSGHSRAVLDEEDPEALR